MKEFNFYSFKGAVETHFQKQNKTKQRWLGSILLNGGKFSSSNFKINIKYYYWCFQAGNALNLQTEQDYSAPHMVFRAPGETLKRHLLRSRTLTLCKAACLHLWPKPKPTG